MQAVRGHFRPEFLNRIDDIVVFDRLSREDLREIVEIQLETLKTRLGERRIDIAFEEDALDVLAERGYDPVYGARPLKRLIQTDVADRLARGLLDGTFVEGQSIKVSIEDGELDFS
jgi:ATP-dependent Clp protease ATP-binding subunit ClpB